ncbi:glycosyltransferase [Roseococcus sp. DSY-14]|uniref:glycosyltransferase n=1 Tax=Roseococcus sp. DSY-14 TaxID=3369650 RepID=UPI00387B3AF3
MSAPRILHVFPSFAVGGAQVRAAALMNHWGGAFRHLVVSLDGRMDCRERLRPGLAVEALPFPALPGEALPARLRRIRRTLAAARPDALVTSNWGSIEWAMANLWPPRLPHLHMEDGFGPDEAAGQLPRRVWTRRLVLRRSRVLLPSRTLLGAARGLWRLPEARLLYVPNGIDLRRFSPDGPRAALEVPGEGPLVGTVAALRAEKNIARLLHALALARAGGAALRLAVIGEGPERPMLEALAGELGLRGCTRFLGHVPDPAAAYRALDLFALSSDTEQMPFSVLEAMGTALPVAATAVGDVPTLLAEGNRPFAVALDPAALGGALAGLARLEPAARHALGAANRARAEAEFDEEVMAARHAALWRGDDGILYNARGSS